MKTSTLGFALLAILAGCASTVQGVSSSEEDAATPDGQIMPDVPVVDTANNADVSVETGSDSATVDTGTSTDAGRRWPISASVALINPATRTIPRNATGVLAAAFDMTDAGDSVPIRMIYFRRVGVGPATDIANVYYYAIPNGSVANTPFRYSLGRAVNPTTNVISMPFESGNLRPGATTTMLIYIDLAPGTTGAQHAIEMTGILVDDGSRDGLLVPITAVRSNPITLSGELASRLDVQNGPHIDYLGMGVANTAIASFRLRAGYHDLGVLRLSFYQAGNVMTYTEISGLELWRGTEMIPISEWVSPVNGYLVLSPRTPIELTAGTTSDFIIRGRVTSPLGRTLRIYAEYPSDVQAVDRALGGVPAATCISSRAIGGCDAPGEGSFDGDTEGDNASTATVVP